MTVEELNELSCTLIACAGDAYAHFNKAISFASRGDFDAYDHEVAEGRDSIAIAHESQLRLLQADISGKVAGMSVLAMHAQDHLMNAMSFENTAKHIADMYRRIVILETRG